MNVLRESLDGISITLSDRIQQWARVVATKWAKLPGVEEIGLFGSGARGDATVKSDRDMYLIISDYVDRREFEYRLLKSIATFGDRIPLGDQPGGLHWVIFSRGEFEKPLSEEDKGIVQNIKLEGKKLA